MSTLDYLSVESGIKIQTRNLVMWKKRLKPEVYKILEDEAFRTNLMAKTGYDVMRGNSLTIYVMNYDLD